MGNTKSKKKLGGAYSLWIRLEDGKEMPVTDYCKSIGRNPNNVYKRYYKGDNIDDLFLKPIGFKIEKYGKEYRSASEWFGLLNVDRVKKGWKKIDVCYNIEVLKKFRALLYADKHTALEIMLDFYLTHENKRFCVGCQSESFNESVKKEKEAA